MAVLLKLEKGFIQNQM